MIKARRRLLSAILVLIMIVTVSNGGLDINVFGGQDGNVITITDINNVCLAETTEASPYKIFKYTAVKTGKFTFYCTNSNGSNWDSYGYLYDDLSVAESDIEYAMIRINKSGMNSTTVHLSGFVAEDDISGEGKNPAITYELAEGHTYYFVLGPYSTGVGAFGIKVMCNHTKTHIENKTLSTCTSGGYTGDEICDICGMVVKKGVMIDEDTDHDYKVTGHTDGDCKHYAATVYTCQICGETRNVEDVEGGYGDHACIIKNARKATCLLDGYSGDQVCSVCGETISKGTIIPKTGHMQETNLKNKMLATCYTEGYSGDGYCEYCQLEMSKGSVLPKLSHDYQNDVCVNCGRIINSMIDTTYSMQTREILPFQVIEFTADSTEDFTFHCMNNGETWDSYGYLFKKDNSVDNVIESAVEKYRTSGNNNDLRLEGCLVSNDEGGEGHHPKTVYKLEKGMTYCYVIGPYANGYGSLNIQIRHSDGETVSDVVDKPTTVDTTTTDKNQSTSENPSTDQHPVTSGNITTSRVVSTTKSEITTKGYDIKNNTTVTVKKISLPKIKKIKNVKKKKAYLKWKKIARATSYEIKYAKNERFKKAKTIKVSSKKVSKTIKGLKKKTYYFKIRAICIAKGIRSQSGWSQIKRLRIKK